MVNRNMQYVFRLVEKDWDPTSLVDVLVGKRLLLHLYPLGQGKALNWTDSAAPRGRDHPAGGSGASLRNDNNLKPALTDANGIARQQKALDRDFPLPLLGIARDEQDSLSCPVSEATRERHRF